MTPGIVESATYDPLGTFSNACHLAVVEVDVETGRVGIEKFLVAEDAGRLINPMIVDGQIYGGFAQGVGTALYEEMPFDRSGQPLASTLADYLLPSAIEVPAPVLVHMETPAPYTEFGVKGIGEGGAIAPPAAIANAINDALRPLGVELLVSPITPQRIIKAIAEQARSQSMARID
jgi:carbon-monoxide dehydrogenase large subunit